MKLFRSHEVEDPDILADKKRVLTMLLENTTTAPEFRGIVTFLSQSSQQVGQANRICIECALGDVKLWYE